MCCLRCGAFGRPVIAEEVLARLRRAVANRRMVGVPMGGPVGSPKRALINRPLTIEVDLDDLDALIHAHDHYRAEFHHHSGGDGMDCDCVELADKWARGEIK